MYLRTMLLAYLTIPQLASASTWSDFTPSFPLTPCQDGWSACLVKGDVVSGALTIDGATVPSPSDLRVAWFSLEPQPVFSPFVTLSEYAYPQGLQTPGHQLGGATRGTPPSGGLKQTAVVRRTPRVASELSGGSTSSGLEEAVPSGPQQEVLRTTHAPGCLPGDGCASDRRPDLIALEPAALLGRLSEDDVNQLEGWFRQAPTQSEKEKVSIHLIKNAWASGQVDEWDRLVGRHLAEVSTADPDLCLAYAVRQLDQGNMEAAIRWSDVAGENRHQWVGDQHISQYSRLLRVRAQAAMVAWERAERARAGSGKPADGEAAELQRGRAKTLVREYHDYLRTTGKDTTTSKKWCESVAGTGHCD